MPLKNALARLKEIYIGGARGARPQIPMRFEELEARAKRVMGHKEFGYVYTGAGDQNSVKNNREAFSKYKIVPRMLRDVSVREIRTSVSYFKNIPPLFLSPVGVLNLACKNGDLELAKACKAVGVPLIISNQASQPMEEISHQLDGSPFAFQLYWSKSDELVRSFIGRAEKSGAKALFITLDTTLLGWRPIDLNNAYLPFLLGEGIAQYTSDPVFNQLKEKYAQTKSIDAPRGNLISQVINAYKLMKNHPGGVFKNMSSRDAIKAVRCFIDIYTRPSLSWDEIKKAREWTDLPIFLKGILHSDDALKAKDYGINGLLVSNHGGRQVDGAISSLDALVNIRKRIDRDFPIILDSGVRTGADIFKALALGADAVGIGRPYVYALGLGKARGVKEYLTNLMAEFELNMALAGCRSISEIKQVALER